MGEGVGRGWGFSLDFSTDERQWGMLAAARFHSTFALLWSRKLPEALPHFGSGNTSEPSK